MHCDFQITASTREETIRRIKYMVDVTKLDLERIKSDGTEDEKEVTLLSVSSSSTTPTIIVDNSTSFLRNLFREERETLKDICRCSCTNDDWSRIYLMLPTSTAITATKDQNSDLSLDLKSLVSNTHFDGFVILDLNNTVEDDEGNNMNSKKSKINDYCAIPPGLHSNICVADSIIHIRSCRVYRNSFVSRTFIGANAVLMNCGHVSSSDKIGTNDSFGKMNILVGAESGGGRSLLLTAESTIVDVCQQLKPCNKIDNDPPPSSIPPFKFNILSRGSIIRDTSTVQSVFLYPFSSIEAACSVKNSTLFDNALISSGSIVSDVVMQWNASISGNSKINNVFLMEQSHLGPSSIVESTVIGPDSHASAGEIHASIVGPNTNAHHQSLMIGVLWPLGRGNVAYGANVGSNHTGRLPDQECTAGEGIFWGLSCIIKFPVDLSMAPYSIIAAGTSLAPQRITMPFSLIVESSSGAGDKRCLNDIVPGWVLQHSPYTLARSEKKFATRRKATRHAFYTGWKILRPSTIERCRLARSALRKALSRDDSTLSPNVSGIGECRLTERARDGGMYADDDCIQLYALRGLLSRLKDVFDKNIFDDTSVSICSKALSRDDSTLSPNVSGIGECRLTERARDGGICAYDNCIQLYALRGLLSWLKDIFDKNIVDDTSVSICSIVQEEFVASRTTASFDDSSRLELPCFPWEIDDNSSDQQEWKYQRKLLLEEFPTRNEKKVYDLPWIRSLLNNLLCLEKDFAERIAKCKRRDDTRGAAIIPGYKKSHVMAETDPVVVDAWKSLEITEHIVEKILAKMATL